jgi:hypothetical protein
LLSIHDCEDNPLFQRGRIISEMPLHANPEVAAARYSPRTSVVRVPDREFPEDAHDPKLNALTLPG